MYLSLQSTLILLLSFGYRRYIIRTGTAYVRLPPRKVVWSWCVLAYVSIAPFWVGNIIFFVTLKFIQYLCMTSLRERSSAVARDLRTFDSSPISCKPINVCQSKLSLIRALRFRYESSHHYYVCPFVYSRGDDTDARTAPIIEYSPFKNG